MQHRNGKLALLTRAAMGTGKAIAETLLAEGWQPALDDINPELLEETRQARRRCCS